ncbi:MAG: hypothetical protein ACLVKO_04315 [Dysgonomonas sp.]
MKTFIFTILIIPIICFASACSDNNKEAKAYLENIRKIYSAGDYETAKQKIDSIQILFPKAFDQIKEGMALLQDVRKAQDEKQVAYCDSVINALQPRIDSVKQALFSYERNKEYEESGRFRPKGTSSSVLNQTTLRSGVEEDGTLFLESVFVGGNQFHNKIKVSTKDGGFAETLAVNDDGFNFRFSNMGKQYEVIKFIRENENSVARFIYANSDKPLTVSLEGKNRMTFGLSNAAKKAISDSYQLSVIMLQADSLRNVKDIAQKKIEYLNNRQQKNVTDTIK